jgi:hypothetical protein
MRQFAQARRDLLLLFSLLLIILLYPALDRGEVRRMILGVLMFAPLLLATVRMAQIKGWVWPAALLMASAVVCAALSIFSYSAVVVGLKWAILSAFFGICAIGLFSYLRKAHTIGEGHLYTAASIYLLLGLQWFAMYSAIDVLVPGSFKHSTSGVVDRHTELLYFSLITLSTVGYGDVVPLHGEVRILAALEGVTGVLYVAITVALLVSAYRPIAKGDITESN